MLGQVSLEPSFVLEANMRLSQASRLDIHCSYCSDTPTFYSTGRDKVRSAEDGFHAVGKQCDTHDLNAVLYMCIAHGGAGSLRKHR